MDPERKNSAEQQDKAETSEKSPKIDYKGIDEEFETAVKEGILRREDRAKAYGKIVNLSPSQVPNALNIVKEYIEIKKKKREEYIKGKPGDRSKMGLDEAEKKGLITARERREWLANYDKMSGEERKKEAEEKFPKRLEQKKLEKKEFHTLLEESPHFSKDGKLTEEGERLLEEYNNPLKNDREKKVLKLRLIKKTGKFDHFAGLCKERYKRANEQYQRGEYDEAMKQMRKNVTTCERNPGSQRLAEYREFAQGDAYNGDYEKLKNEEIFDKREEVQECFRGKDHEGGVKCAREAVEMTERFLKMTYDGRNGEYQKGAPEKQRDEKWVTPYMTRLMEKVKKEQKTAEKIYEKLFKEEQEEEERIVKGEEKLISDEQSEDLRNQAIIKASLNTLEDRKSGRETEPGREREGGERKGEQHDLSPGEEEEIMAGERDKEEDDEAEEVLWMATRHGGRAERGERRKEGRESDDEEDTIDRLSGKGGVIDEEAAGRLQERDAQELLDSGERLHIEKKNQAFTSEEEIKRHLNTSLEKDRQTKIKQLHRSGKISDENVQDHLNNTGDIAQEIIQEHRRGEDIVNRENKEQTKSRLSQLFQKNRNISVIRSKNAEQKKAQREERAA